MNIIVLTSHTYLPYTDVCSFFFFCNFNFQISFLGNYATGVFYLKVSHTSYSRLRKSGFWELLCTLRDGSIILFLRITKIEKQPGHLLISLLLKVDFSNVTERNHSLENCNLMGTQ